MRSISKDKFPAPPFDYAGFLKWRNPDRHFAIEIGCGVGLHPIRWAQQNSDSQILAIERTKDKFEKFHRRLQNHPEIKNIFPAHADAAQLLPHLLCDLEQKRRVLLQIVDEYIILYPNPYPKNSHKNIRLAFSPLTRYLVETLKPDGKLHIATNIGDYMREVTEHLPRTLPVELMRNASLSKGFVPRSHFEKKYLDRGDTCYDLTFRRATNFN